MRGLPPESKIETGRVTPAPKSESNSIYTSVVSRHLTPRRPKTGLPGDPASGARLCTAAYPRLRPKRPAPWADIWQSGRCPSESRANHTFPHPLNAGASTLKEQTKDGPLATLWLGSLQATNGMQVDAHSLANFQNKCAGIFQAPLHVRYIEGEICRGCS